MEGVKKDDNNKAGELEEKVSAFRGRKKKVEADCLPNIWKTTVYWRTQAKEFSNVTF